MTVTEKIENIEQTIKRHEYNFYVLGEKTISTPELEILKVELYNLKHLDMDDSPKEDSHETSGTDSNDNSFEFFEGI
jgi:hypothetical protein